LEIASGDSHFSTASTTNPLSPKPKAKRVAWNQTGQLTC